MEQVESKRGKATITQSNSFWIVTLTSKRTGDIFMLTSTDERRAHNKYFQFKAWVQKEEEQ